MALQTTTVPLGVELPPDVNGTIQVISTKPLEALRAELEGIFSFVLYFRNNPDFFSTSLYYAGILSYLQAVQQNPRFARWSVVVYTDASTLPILQSAFPSSTYPQLVLCVVDWPVYTDSDGLPERNVFRCLRYQCAELFPTQICCIRDADTLFQRVITNCKEKSETLAEFSHSLGTWEQTFIDTWLGTELIQKPIVIGTDYSYGKDWHSNVPQNFPLRASTSYLERWASKKMGLPFESPLGVFAGFVNFGPDKSTFRDIWTRSVQYLLSRFSMVRGGFENEYKRIVSNKHAQYLTGGIVGKDEKIILFVFLRFYIDHCFFFSIQYQLENGSSGTLPGGFVAEPFTKNEKYNLYDIPKSSYKLVGHEDPTVQWKLIPPISLCGVRSGMLNPAYIDFILRVAKIYSKSDTINYNIKTEKRNTYTAYTVPLHIDLEQTFRSMKDKYESWLATVDISTLKKYLLAKSKHLLQSAIHYYFYYNGRPADFRYGLTETSPSYLEELYKKLRPVNASELMKATDIEDLFLNRVGPYTKEEEAHFAEQLEEERQTLLANQEKKKQNRLAENINFQNTRAPWAAGRFGFGGRHRTRKHRRHMKKRKATRRRT
jgi:hypothetical protein